MYINCDPAYLKFFTNGAFAVREKIPVRMLENPPQNAIAFDVNVNYVHPYSRTTRANNVKFSKLNAGTTAILNIGYASYSRGNFTPKKA